MERGMINDKIKEMIASGEPGIAVLSANPNGQTPDATPTEIQVLMHVPAMGTIVVMRLYSAEMVDQLISALIEHREDVFGEIPKQ